MKKLLAFLVAVGLMVIVLTVAQKPKEQAGPVQPPPDGKAVPIPDNPLPEPIQPQPKKMDLLAVKNSISETRIRQIVGDLCNPKWEGRQPGQRGCDEACDYMAGLFRSAGLQPGMTGGYHQPFTVRAVNEKPAKSSGRTNNIIGVLPGGPRCIVFGAHVDHLGYGPASSRAPNRREIHPGADDNATSCAVLAEVARAWGAYGNNKHTIIFIAFSAEEMGLVGSEFYCTNPIRPLNTVDFMCNMDMIGRYKDHVGFLGAGNSPELIKAIGAAQTPGVSVKSSSNPGGGSDHAPFAKRQIPAVFIHTGLHGDYHTPDDTAEKINYPALTNIAKLTFHFLVEVDNLGTRPSTVNLYVPNDGPFKDHDADWPK